MVAPSHNRCYPVVCQLLAASQGEPLDSLAVHEGLYGPIVDLVAQVGEIEALDEGAVRIIACGILYRFGDALEVWPGVAKRSVPQCFHHIY